MHEKALRVPHQRIASRLLHACPEMRGKFDRHLMSLSDAQANRLLSYLNEYSAEDDSLFDAMSERLVPQENGTSVYIRSIAAAVPVLNSFCMSREDSMSYLTSLCLLMDRKASEPQYDKDKLELSARGIMFAFLCGNVETQEPDHILWLGEHAEELAVHRELLKQHRDVSPRMCQLALTGTLLETETPFVAGAL